MQQDPERIQAIAGFMDALQYCSTEDIKVLTEFVLAFKGPEVMNNGKRKKAPVRSMANTGQEIN